RLDSVGFSEKEGYFLNVSGVDLLDNTPIYDIKPYIPMADCFPDARGGYSDENASHALEVEFSKDCELEKIPESDLVIIKKCISEDPRPSYQEDGSRVYKMKYKKYDVCFTVSGKRAVISEIITEK
ncbi:MAG: SAM-dependent methyltransferase, partial [Clostridia bacterium]|nr:SAM-dependent methyltransferase [Clostridia bacterium]